MSKVSIVGTGNMGRAIAGIVEKGGNTAELLGSDDTDKPVTGEIVVLAVPYPAVDDVLAQRGDQLTGKIVVDITNPLDFETFDSLTVPADSSAAAEIAAALPSSRVVKAFNTTFAPVLHKGRIGDQVAEVLLAGDDDDAKAVVTGLAERAGLNVVDAGVLSNAQTLERMTLLLVELQGRYGLGFNAAFRFVPGPVA